MYQRRRRVYFGNGNCCYFRCLQTKSITLRPERNISEIFRLFFFLNHYKFFLVTVSPSLSAVPVQD